jgi:Domain of unknown function (DUF4440)
MPHRFARLLVIAALCSVPALADEAPVNLTPGPKASPELIDAVLRADAEFFKAVSDTCDIATVRRMVTDDLEFFHDKWGLTGTSGAQFVKSIEDKCQRQRDGIDFLSRRELVRESVKIYPLNKYGAIETGTHRFYAVASGRPERLTEVAQFTQVWKEENGAWRLARVLSYDHQLAEEPKP